MLLLWCCSNSRRFNRWSFRGDINQFISNEIWWKLFCCLFYHSGIFWEAYKFISNILQFLLLFFSQLIQLFLLFLKYLIIFIISSISYRKTFLECGFHQFISNYSLLKLVGYLYLVMLCIMSGAVFLVLYEPVHCQSFLFFLFFFFLLLRLFMLFFSQLLQFFQLIIILINHGL